MLHCAAPPLRLTLAVTLDAGPADAEPDSVTVACREALTLRVGNVKESVNEVPVVVAVPTPDAPDDTVAVV